jgi:superfamily I DNA and RNA helicase
MTTEQAFEIADALREACKHITKLSDALEAHHNSNYEYGLIEEAKDFVDKTYDLME